MESLDKEVTNEDRLKAIASLRTDVLGHIEAQQIINNKLDKSLTLLKRLLIIGLALSIGFIGVQIYNYYNPPASLVDQDRLVKDRETLLTQRKLLNYDKEEFQKEKAIFVLLKVRTDSANAALQQENVRLMANIFKQDSIARLKQVIKADVVNANTVNTVNAKTVQVKKK